MEREWPRYRPSLGTRLYRARLTGVRVRGVLGVLGCQGYGSNTDEIDDSKISDLKYIEVISMKDKSY